MNHLVYLACYARISNRRLNQLAAYFFNLDHLIKADCGELIRAGLDLETSQKFIAWRKNNQPEKIADQLASLGIWSVSLGEEKYPRLLENIYDPPVALFIRGELPPNSMNNLSVVGTRKVTAYGKYACDHLISPLAGYEIAIISGLALGLDAIAHETSLKAGITTLAVLGGGVDRATVAPRANQNLAERIVDQGGALISEYPPSYSPNSYTFPARNRIIAGLSRATLVIEAPRSSGAMITARCALDYNRDILTIPHQINSLMGEGCNSLIQNGAQLITHAEEIAQNFGIEPQSTNDSVRHNKLSNSAAEQKIIFILNHEPKHLDAIIEQTKLTSAEAASATAMLEIRGLVRNIGNGRYVKAKQ